MGYRTNKHAGLIARQLHMKAGWWRDAALALRDLAETIYMFAKM